MYFLHYTSCIESKNIMLREFLAADVQRIIGIRPIRTMLQQVLFCLSQLLPGLLETIPSPADPSHQRTGSNRARELHPHPLTEPCVKVSPHTALHTLCFVHMLLSSYVPLCNAHHRNVSDCSSLQRVRCQCLHTDTERPSLISLAATATFYIEG